MKKLNTILTISIFLLASLIAIINFWLLPLGNGRDEIELLQVIDFYHTQKRFPTLPDDWASSSWSAHHPPLYFMLTAALIELGLPEPQSHNFILNPFANREYYPRTNYNRVAVVTEPAWFSQGKTQTWYALRALSVFFHAVAAVAFWRTAELVFNEDWRMGVPLALALFILAPVFLQFAVVINNDALLMMLSCLIYWLLARILRFGFHWSATVGIGVLLGLGLLTKIFIFPLVVTIPVVFLWYGKTQPRVALRHLLTVILLSALISLWWYLRNYHLYGDFTAASVNEGFVGTHRKESISWGELRGVLTLWAGGTWLEAHLVTPTTATWSNIFSIVGNGVFLLGVIGAGIGCWRQAAVKNNIAFILIPTLVGYLFMVYGVTRNIHGGSTTIMRVALPAICLLFSLSILTWSPRRWRDVIAGVVITALVSLLLIFEGAFFLSQYPPIRVKAASKLEMAHHLNIDFENGVRFLGYEIPEQHLQPGEITHVKLCWEALQTLNPEQNYAFTLQLVLPEHPTAALLNSYHASGRFPTSVWKPGDAFCEWVPLEVRQDAITPRAYDVRVGLFIPDGDDIRYYMPDGELNNYLVVDKIGVTKPSPGSAPIIAQVDTWGALTRYDAQLEDGKFTLILDWLTQGSTETPYIYYLHALDADGNLIAQLDRPPMNGLFPTHFWAAGVAFSDSISLDVPPEAVVFRFGVYDSSTFQRGLWQVNGESVGDGLTIEIPNRD